MAVIKRKRVFDKILSEVNVETNVPLCYVHSLYVNLINGETIKIDNFIINDMISSGAKTIFDVDQISSIADQIVGISVRYASNTLEKAVKESVDNTFKKAYGK
jgi:hypothetical protein